MTTNTTDNLFDLLSKATRDAVWTWDIDNDTVWWNEGYSTMFGYPADRIEPGSESWSNYLHPDDKDRIIQSINKAIDQGSQNWSGEYRFRRADGTYATIFDRGYILHRNGKAVRMVGAMQDVSERMALQQASQASEERLRLALESAQLGTWEIDPIADTIIWDEHCSKLLGLPKLGHVPTDKYMQYIHPDDKVRVTDTVNWALNPKSGGYYQCIYRILDNDSCITRWVRSTGQTYFSDEGQPYRFSGVAQDITLEVLSREKNELAEQQAQLALEGSGAGSFLVDLTTDALFYSPTFARILTGNETANLTRNDFVECIHPDDRIIREQAYRDGAISGTISYEVRFIWPNESIRWVKAIGQYIYEQNIPVSFSGIILDITDQKEKSRALKEAEARFSIAFANTSVGMAFADTQANFTVVNEAYTHLLGYSTDELCQLNSIQLTHPNDRELNRKLFNDVAQGKQPFFNLVKRYVRKDNTFRWVQMNVTRLADAQDESQSIVIIAYDITEAIEAETKIRESEERFRNIVMQAPMAISVLNGSDFTIDIANDAILELWGKEESIIGLPLVKALPEIEGQGFLKLLYSVYETGTAHYGFETKAYLFRKGHLEESYFNFVYAPVINGDQTTGIMVVATEVTSQVNTKIALQESEQRFRDLIAKAPVAISLFVGPDMIIEMPNEKMIEFWGKGNSVVGKPLRKALPELEGQPFLGILDKVYATGITHSEQEAQANLVINGEMQTLYFNYTYKPLQNADGEVYAILDIAVEVTEQVMIRKKIEELAASLEQQVQARTEQLTISNQELRRSNENLERFAYIASHDLQEPLRKIQSFGDILKSQYTDQLGQGIDYLERMQLAANRMSMLIRDLLTFSRISTRQEHVTYVSLNNIIAEVLDDLEVTIEQKGAHIEIDTLPSLVGDESQLRQLFQNLISNALKFQKPDVTPHIQIQSESLPANKLPVGINPARLAQQYLCLRVIDNGIGFDSKYIDRIFQVFQRLHSRNEYAGTGIGLAICEKVVINHGGAITANSQVGEGTTFLIYFPID